MHTDKLAERETFLADVVILAVEGDGDPDDGTRYWAEVSEYVWFDPDLEGGKAEPSPHGGGNAYAKVFDLEDTHESEYELTPQVVSRAMRRLLAWKVSGDTAKLSAHDRDRILKARAAGDAGALSSYDADTVVQIGLFGEVRYDS